MSTTAIVFRATAFALAGAVLLFLGLGYTLADRWSVMTTRTLRGSEQRLAALVGDLGAWQQWSTTAANLGAPTTREVQGTPGAAGQRIVWRGPRGEAVLSVAELTSGHLAYQFTTTIGGGEPVLRGTGRITWQASADGCVVSWIDEGRWNNFAGRWIGWFGAVQENQRAVQRASLEGLQQVLAADGAGGGVR